MSALRAGVMDGEGTLLHEACRRVTRVEGPGESGHRAVAMLLLSHPKVDVNAARGHDGATPLHIAARWLHSGQAHTAELVALVDALLVAKADLTRRDHHGATPLHVAAATGNDV